MENKDTERARKIKSYQEKYLPPGMRSRNFINLEVAACMEKMYAKEAEVVSNVSEIMRP